MPMVRGGKFTFVFIFLLEQHWRASPDIFQSDFTFSADTFEQTHTHWIALCLHAPPKRGEIWRTLFEKKENFRQKFLTVSACHFAIWRGDLTGCALNIHYKILRGLYKFEVPSKRTRKFVGALYLCLGF